jgi:hypothetical protein
MKSIFEDSSSSLQDFAEALKRTQRAEIGTQTLLPSLIKTEKPRDGNEDEGLEEDTSTSPRERSADETDIVPDKHIKFGRGTAIYDWPGNIMFRELVKKHQMEYKSFGDTRIGKTALSREIFDTLRNDGTYFWDRQKGSNEWCMLDYDADSKKIREKISSALRSPYDDTSYYRNKRERFEQKKKGGAVVDVDDHR